MSRKQPSDWNIRYKLFDSLGRDFRGKANYSYHKSAGWCQKPCVVLYSYGTPVAILTPPQLPGSRPRVRDYDSNGPVVPPSQTTAKHIRAFEYQSDKLCRRLEQLVKEYSGRDLRRRLA